MSVYPLWRAEVPEESAEEIQRKREELEAEVDACCEVRGPYRNKVKKFLEIQEIWHISEIDYQVRVKFEEFLKTEVKPVSFRMYRSGFDQIKRHSIQEQIQTLKGKRDALAELNNQVIFLPYYPEQEIADQFIRFTNVNNLVWDFKQKAPPILKKQIFDVLQYMLRQHIEVKQRSEILGALKKIYEFCVLEQVEDIEYLEQKQIDRFRESIPYKREQELGMRVLNQCRRIIFIQADKINWNANIWYLERFFFEKSRVNPTNEVKTISFVQVADKENRKYLQQYMKYCLGVTHLSISVLRTEYTFIRNLAIWLEKERTQNICYITNEVIGQYFRSLEQSNIKEEMFNRIVTSIAHFYDYLKVRGIIEKVPFCEQYYLKKEVLKHHDRSVQYDTYMEILDKLQFFPENLRLMFLHLWGIGLRVSEVCSLKGDAYYIQGRDAWIQVYQIKMHNYKRIPIPWMLYKLMEVYRKKHGIASDDYIFQNKKGGAYHISTFRSNMLKYCKENKIANGEYLFKSHDYRHTVATMYYENGVSLQSIRDYLGHDYEEMTRRYIDYMPNKISKANEEFFEREESSLSFGIKRCKREK